MLDQSKFTLCILLSEFARQIELAKLCTFETFSFQVYGFRNNCLVTLFFMLSIQVTLCVKKLSLNIDLWFSQTMNSHSCEVCTPGKFDVTHIYIFAISSREYVSGNKKLIFSASKNTSAMENTHSNTLDHAAGFMLITDKLICSLHGYVVRISYSDSEASTIWICIWPWSLWLTFKKVEIFSMKSVFLILDCLNF